MEGVTVALSDSHLPVQVSRPQARPRLSHSGGVTAQRRSNIQPCPTTILW